MTVSVNLAPETAKALQELADRYSLTLAAYLEELANREARSVYIVPSAAPKDREEFERLLDQLAEGLPALSPLPADFSRADIYAEHD